MEHSKVQTVATADTAYGSSFDGRLIRRHYKPGQRYIQLVFETTEGARLSLSRNLHLVRSLTVGESYRIEGPEYMLGDKTYIHEPKATRLPYALKKSRKHRLMIFAVIAVVLIGGIAAALVLNQHHAVQLQANPTAQQTKLGTETSPAVNSNTAFTSQDQATTSANDNASNATVPTATKPTTTPTPKTTTTPSTPVVQPPVTPVVIPPVEDCDPIAIVPFATTTQPDASPVGTPLVTGQNGKSQLCYPNGRDAAGVPNPDAFVQEIDEIDSSGPATP